MRVLELMHAHPQVARPSESLAAATARMQAHDIKRLPVVDGENHLYGIIAFRDIDRATMEAAREAQRTLLDSRQVRSLMIRRPITCSPDNHLRAAAALMLRNRIGFLPVVEETRLVGVLTTTDLLQAAATLDLAVWQQPQW